MWIFIWIVIGIFLAFIAWFLFVYVMKKIFIAHSKYGYPSIFLVLAILITWISVFWYQIHLKKNISLEASNIVFVLDVSKSMLALDYGEDTRLQVAKNLIKEYILKYPNNKYALTIFAWDVTSLSPFTSDTDLFLNFLNTANTDSILKQGSNFYQAIDNASTRFIDDVQGWALVVLSDFEPTDTSGNFDTNQKQKEIEIIWALKTIFQEKNIVFYGIWLGDNVWNNIISWYDYFRNPIYLKDNFWKNVITKFDSDFLNKISQKLWWETFIIHKKEDIKNIVFKHLPAENTESEKFVQTDLSRFMMMIAFVFLLSYLILFYYFDRKWK